MKLHSKHIIHLSTLSKSIRDGRNIMFWKDVRVESVPLIELFPRLYALDVDSNCVVIDKRQGNN